MKLPWLLLVSLASAVPLAALAQPVHDLHGPRADEVDLLLGAEAMEAEADRGVLRYSGAPPGKLHSRESHRAPASSTHEGKRGQTSAVAWLACAVLPEHPERKANMRHMRAFVFVISGVMTHLCCETTARAAFMRGFEVFFTVDGTATYNEALHRSSLLTLSHGFAIPVLIDELLCDMEPDEA